MVNFIFIDDGHISWKRFNCGHSSEVEVAYFDVDAEQDRSVRRGQSDPAHLRDAVVLSAGCGVQLPLAPEQCVWLALELPVVWQVV